MHPPYEHKDRVLLANEFCAIWKLHDEDKSKRAIVDSWGLSISDFKYLLVENIDCYLISSGYTSLNQLFARFLLDKNDPAIKILLTRSETLKEQLAENQRAIESRFKDKPYKHKILLDDVCRDDDGATIMNFFPQGAAGNIEHNHFVYALSQAMGGGRKKLITFLVKKEPDKIKNLRKTLLKNVYNGGIPTACQIIRYLFLDNTDDINQSAQQALDIAIEKNDTGAIGFLLRSEYVDLVGLCGGQILHKVCLKLPQTNDSLSFIRALLNKGVNPDARDSEGKMVLEKIDFTGLNEQNKEILRGLLVSKGAQQIDSDQKNIVAHEIPIEPVDKGADAKLGSIQALREHQDNTYNYTCGSDHLNMLFTKGICRYNIINRLIKYGKFISFTALCYVILKISSIVS